MQPLQAVLFDRDGTLVVDVPYNGDPGAVVPVDGARKCLDRLRAAELKLGIVSNQSGIGRGTITYAQMEAVNARIEEMLGNFDGWFVCPHAPEDDCACRKPKPKLLLDAADAFGVEPSACVFIGDTDVDVEAARNAGMRMLRVGSALTLAQACSGLLRMQDERS
ncbi:MAG TPA: HAD family hydrolase [Candidatus Dormibacteraeota bacterium]|nr:HAD family hydrolase [Candidatus Dormibacteraeota bacterium]